MPNICITDKQLRLFEDRFLKDRLERIGDDKEKLENFVEAHGEYMTDITNGKTYLVQYLQALSDLVGKKYCLAAPVKEDGTYSAFFVKPYESFNNSPGKVNMNKPNMKPMELQGNLYQQMGLE